MNRWRQNPECAKVTCCESAGQSSLAKGAKIDEKDDVYEFTALHYAASLVVRTLQRL
jgi:hypothetical protein